MSGRARLVALLVAALLAYGSAAAAQSGVLRFATEWLAALVAGTGAERVAGTAAERVAGTAAERVAVTAAERVVVAAQLRRFGVRAPGTSAVDPMRAAFLRAYSIVGPEDAALAVRLGLPGDEPIQFLREEPPDPAPFLGNAGDMRRLLATSEGRDLVAAHLSEIPTPRPRAAPTIPRLHARPQPAVFGDVASLVDVHRRILAAGGRPSRRFFAVIQSGPHTPEALRAALETPVRRVRLVYAMPASAPELRGMYAPRAAPPVSERHLTRLQGEARALHGDRVTVQARPSARLSSAYVNRALGEGVQPGELRVLVAHSSRPGFVRFGNGDEVALATLRQLNRPDSPLLVIACDTALATPADGVSVQLGTLTRVRAEDALAAVRAIAPGERRTVQDVMLDVMHTRPAPPPERRATPDPVADSVGWVLPFFAHPLMVYFGTDDGGRPAGAAPQGGST